jgi:hypothetical protein
MCRKAKTQDCRRWSFVCNFSVVVLVVPSRVYKWSINPFTNRNPVCNHRHTWHCIKAPHEFNDGFVSTLYLIFGTLFNTHAFFALRGQHCPYDVSYGHCHGLVELHLRFKRLSRLKFFVVSSCPFYSGTIPRFRSVYVSIELICLLFSFISWNCSFCLHETAQSGILRMCGLGESKWG